MFYTGHEKILCICFVQPFHRKIYHGRSEGVELRLKEHNAGKVKSTKHGIPWIIIYTEELDTLEESVSREKYFKTATGRKFLRSIKLKYKP